MNTCTFFEPLIKNIESQIIHGDRQPNNISQVDNFWCSHPKHSPLSFKIANRTIGANKLQCQGNIEKCILSEEQYFDI